MTPSSSTSAPLEPGEGIIGNWVQVQQGKIVGLGTHDCTPHDASELIDGGGRLLTPGLIDIHTHGIERFAYESGPEQIVAAAQRLGQYGTTCVLPTLYRVLSPERLGELERLAAALPQSEYTCMPGFHMEGPFLALAGTKAPDPAR